MREKARDGGRRRHSKMFAASAPSSVSVLLLLFLSIQCATTATAGVDPFAGSPPPGRSSGTESRAGSRAWGGEGPNIEVYGSGGEHRASVDGTFSLSGARKGKHVCRVSGLYNGFILLLRVLLRAL